MTDQGGKECLGFRYAIDPENNNSSFNLLSWFPPELKKKAAELSAAQDA